jgi:hypothetical protein
VLQESNMNEEAIAIGTCAAGCSADSKKVPELNESALRNGARMTRQIQHGQQSCEPQLQMRERPVPSAMRMRSCRNSDLQRVASSLLR